ncbi:MAG: type II secretion system protein [Rickettsiales bacterium]
MLDKKHGFTLIEISIVLVILGFIIAGVITGSSLLRVSEIRAVMAEAASYKLALGNFRDKYQALPGDFASASSVWSGASDGNGDGLITNNLAATQLAEQFTAWQQLASAEMIKGNFTGVAGAAGVRDRVVGVNSPVSQLTGAGWGLISVTLTDIAGGYVEIPYTAPDVAPNHVLWLGGGTIAGGIVDTQNPVLKPAEAYDIDAKQDDGLPTTGKIVAQTNTTPACYTGTAYNASSSNIACALVFKTGL